MDVNEPKKRMTGGQGVQQLHLSLAQSQPDSGNTLIDNNVHDSMQGSSNNHKKNSDSPVKKSTVDGKDLYIFLYI